MYAACPAFSSPYLYYKTLHSKTMSFAVDTKSKTNRRTKDFKDYQYSLLFSCLLIYEKKTTDSAIVGKKLKETCDASLRRISVLALPSRINALKVSFSRQASRIAFAVFAVSFLECTKIRT